MADFIKGIFEQATKLGASDIHIHSDQQPAIRIDGQLYTLEDHPVISHQDLDDYIQNMLRPDQLQGFKAVHQIDTSREYHSLGVLRIHIYRQRGKLAMANRIIGNKVPDIKDLGLPPLVQKLCHQKRGLILVSGATSNGKSTTLAAMIEEINKHYARHILTIEDPIEFIFKNRKSVFSQRDIGIDTTGFSASIVAAMREDPDVILISDLRDNESIENALTAAETGHLVFATTHAPTAPDSITRLVATFAAEKQDSIRIKLAQNLRAVVAQRLIPKAGGIGRIRRGSWVGGRPGPSPRPPRADRIARPSRRPVPIATPSGASSRRRSSARPASTRPRACGAGRSRSLCVWCRSPGLSSARCRYGTHRCRPGRPGRPARRNTAPTAPGRAVASACW